MRDTLSSARVRSAASDVYESVILARSEAIKRAASVEVVPAAGGWQDGWTVKVGTVVLQGHDPVKAVTITASASGNLAYGLDGRLSTPVRGFVLTSSETGGVPARCVTVDAGGRPGVKTDTDGNSANGCN